METIILPLIVDQHVHARDQGFSHKSDFESFRKAALHGGVGFVADMPNNNPPTLTLNDINTRQELATKALPVKVYSYIGVTPDSKPHPNLNLYKAFVVPSFKGPSFENYQQIRKTFENYSGSEITVHCEDPKIIEENKNKKLHEDKRPAVAEEQAIGELLDICYDTNVSLNVAHISTKKSFDMINAKKKSFANIGLRLRSEVSYHNILVSREDRYADEVHILGKKFKLPNIKYANVNVPLRYRSDCDYLFEQAKKGKIDAIISDNAPHLISEKQSENIPSGLTILDFEAPIVGLLHDMGISWEVLVNMTHNKPMQYITKDYNYKYQINKNTAANFVILEKKPQVISDKNVRDRHGWCYLSGLELPYTVKSTIINGQIY